jgi:riboflavin synthase
MFTGIIECLGKVESISKIKNNVEFWISASFVDELKVDQSIAHNGVCLTVVEIKEGNYKVTAIDETLQKSNLGNLKINDFVNLERCMVFNGRIDGHLVQGHVDTTAKVTHINDEQGSWKIGFEYASNTNHITVEKGSICVNGVSLTVVNSSSNSFEVAIIPYTWENTTFRFLKVNEKVNLEFDILGKYVARITSLQNLK